MSDSSPAPKAKRVFIVACRRSGTTWVTMLLSQHPQVVGVQQSSFFHRVDYLGKYLDEEVKYGRHIITAADSSTDQDTEATPDDDSAQLERRPVRNLVPISRFHDYIRPFAEEVYDQLAQCAEDARAVIDHQPENVRSWKHIVEIFPDAYFLHVVRDPRSVFSSYVHSARSWSNPETFTCDPTVFSREWQDDVYAGREIPLRTDHHLEVRYEDLVANGPAELARIHEFLDLPSSPQKCTQAVDACSLDRLRKSGHGPSGFFRKGQAQAFSTELSRSMIETIEYDCAGLMQELGYEPTLANGGPRPLSMRLRNRLKRILWMCHRAVRRPGSA